MTRVIVGVLAFLLAAAAGPAMAAPQILGLVATNDPVPMQCEDGACTALLSAFCLQEKRLPPDFETLYRPAAAGSVTLVATMADGSVQRLDASGLVSFHSRYGFTAVRADLVPGRLGAMAPVSLALEIAPRTTMLPEARPGPANRGRDRTRGGTLEIRRGIPDGRRFRAGARRPGHGPSGERAAALGRGSGAGPGRSVAPRCWRHGARTGAKEL